MIIVDAHAHLADPVFDADRDQVMARAREAGLSHVVLVAETLADAQRNLALARANSGHAPRLLPAAGLYPNQLDPELLPPMIAFVRAHRDALIAIGEVGLDHWLAREEPERRRQGALFGQFIALSLELDLPLNVHSRSAGRCAVAQLLEMGARRVVMHAFDGKAAAAAPAVEAGFFFSIPPSVVRSRQKQKLVKALPLANLLLETDSPVLGPEPDQRNEPANIRRSVAAIAELKGIAPEAVLEATANNARALFGGAVSVFGGQNGPPA